MKISILFFFLFGCASGFCQVSKDSTEIPSAIKEKFFKLYPDAIIKEWNDNSMFSIDSIKCPISIDFVIGEKWGWTVFDLTGISWYTQLHLPFEAMPNNTKTYLKRKYPRFITQDQFWKMLDKHPRRKFYLHTYFQFMYEQEGSKVAKKYLLIYYKGEKGFFRSFDKDGNLIKKGPYSTF